jgi:signal transduction histidine kinase
VFALVLPGLLSGATTDDRSVIVSLTARDYAATVEEKVARLGRLPNAGEIQLGESGLRLAAGEAMVTADRSGVRIPYTDTLQDDAKPMSLALLFDPGGRIVASSYPARYAVGQQADGSDGLHLPTEAMKKVLTIGKGGGQTKLSTGDVLWAIAPVMPFTGGSDLGVKRADPEAKKVDLGAKKTAADPLGLVYVQVPADSLLPVPMGRESGSAVWDNVSAQLGAGLLVMLAALPVGAVFGLFSTRRLIGRLRRLAASTVAVADGDYQRRVAVSGADEVAQLETSFNRMAERLTDAIAAERHVASANERARIARELHDSISQDLFSLRLLAGGLRRALPAESPLYTQVEAMERTATGTMHEMQALLLELRPVVLQDTGLIPALNELCQAYSDRLGITIIAELEAVELDPAVEHAVLRIVQEALANAVKHARPNRIVLRIRRDDLQVAVSVTDDGAGFDPARAGERHGMGLELMRERVAELGGSFQLDSAPGEGTSVRILLPRGWP